MNHQHCCFSCPSIVKFLPKIKKYNFTYDIFVQGDGLIDLLKCLIMFGWSKKSCRMTHSEKAVRWFHLHCHCGSWMKKLLVRLAGFYCIGVNRHRKWLGRATDSWKLSMTQHKQEERNKKDVESQLSQILLTKSNILSAASATVHVKKDCTSVLLSTFPVYIFIFYKTRKTKAQSETNPKKICKKVNRFQLSA